MSSFDDRWLRLIEAARRAGADPAGPRIEDSRAARIALIAREHARRRARAMHEARGLALAAGVFLVFIAGLLWSARAFDFGPSLGDVGHEIASLARRAPNTSFIPPPPRPADFALPMLAQFEPKLADWPGARILTSIDDWFTLPHSSAESSQ
jgi:hypothetical protein